MAHVRALVDDLSAGSGSAVVIRGEAGIGKSHLVEVASEFAASTNVRLVVTGTDELARDRPANLLVQAIDALTVVEDGERTGAEGPADGFVAVHDQGYRVIDRFVSTVQLAATDRPVLIVAEDLHWADELSLRGLAALIGQIDQVPCTVLATLRPHPRPRRLGSVEAALSSIGGRAIELRGLGSGAVEELAGAYLGAKPGPNLRTVLAGSAGNPFMIEELVLAADREDLLHMDEGLADVETAGALPRSLRGALFRRVESLPPATIDLLRVASLLGTKFTATEVAAIADRSVVDVVKALEPAVDSGLVDTHEAFLGFRHDLVRDAVYDSVAAAARWDLHRAAAVTLARIGTPALRVAEQFSAGARPGDLEAVRWMQRAAEEARAIDTGAAADLYQRLLTIAPGTWPDRFACEAELVELLAWSGRIDEASARGEQLVARALDEHQRTRAHQALGSVCSSVGDLGSAAHELRLAADEVGVQSALGAQLVGTAAGMMTIAGLCSPDVAGTEAIALIDREEPEVVCAARNTLAVTSMARGAYDEALDHARVSAALVEDQYVRPLGFLIPHSWIVAALMYLDRIDEAHDAIRHGRNVAETRGDTGLLMQLMAAACGLSWASADWDETVAELDAAFTLVNETGVVAQDILLHALASHVARERGQAYEADAHLAAGEAIAAGGTKHLFGLELLSLERARVARIDGELEQSCDLLLAVWEATTPMLGLVQWRLVGPELVKLCVETRRQQQAVQIVATIATIADRSRAPSATATMRRCAGLLNRDVRVMTAAADAMLATPRLVEAAGACEDAAEVLIETGAHGGDDDLARMLDAAERIHRRTSAITGLERVRTLRSRAGITTEDPTPRPTFGWQSLTPKESEVVALVSRGMSNPEIATELFISRRTVEAHLSHVFRKLDVTNRTQLARDAIERGMTC